LVHQTIPDLPVPAHIAHDSKRRRHFHAGWSRQAAGATLLYFLLYSFLSSFR
jgi:hypothetical protein